MDKDLTEFDDDDLDLAEQEEKKIQILTNKFPNEQREQIKQILSNIEYIVDAYNEGLISEEYLVFLKTIFKIKLGDF